MGSFTLPKQTGHLDSSPLALFSLLVGVALLLGYSIIVHLHGGIGDEDVHRFQINWFINGRIEIFKYVTMIPLYHGLVAFFAKISGLTSLNGLRFVHMLLAMGVVPAMYRLVRCFYPDESISRTLLFMFTPVIFPLFFLTYTDLPSLALVLVMLERAWSRHYFWAGVAALFAVLMRQPNIIWVVFTGGVIALRTAQTMSLSINFRTPGSLLALFGSTYIMAILRKCRWLLLVFGVFAIFVVLNGGVALGDAEQHQVTLNLSNLYFFLLVAFVLFLPFNLEQVGDIYRLICAHWWLVLVLAGLFFIYFNTYGHPHKYNSPELDFYRHNLFLYYTSDIRLLRVLSFFPMAWMTLSFITTIQKSQYRGIIVLTLGFGLLSFMPLPLIEQRYYLVALTLFLAMRPPMTMVGTYATLGVFIALDAYILFNISQKTFFL